MKTSLKIALTTLALGTAFSQASAQTSRGAATVYGPQLEGPQSTPRRGSDDSQYRLPQLRLPTEQERTDCRVGMHRIGLRLRCGSADPTRYRPDPTQIQMRDMSGRRR